MIKSKSKTEYGAAGMLWTGGKDSMLALHEARAQGCEIAGLITFTPENPCFLAHPLDIIRLQAEAMQLPHMSVTIREPYDEGYAAALRGLKEWKEIDTLITGDIATVNCLPNWIRKHGRRCGLKVLTPLWGRSRFAILKRLLALNYRVIISCVRGEFLKPEWAGREINRETLDEMRRVFTERNLDLCGEQGEYHSLVLDGPEFHQPIVIKNAKTVSAGDFHYLKIEKAALSARASLEPVRIY